MSLPHWRASHLNKSEPNTGQFFLRVCDIFPWNITKNKSSYKRDPILGDGSLPQFETIC